MTAKAKEATDAKFNFFTNISHEFRTPAYLDTGPRGRHAVLPQASFYFKNNLGLVHRNAIRLLRLINQLMDFRKIEEQRMNLVSTENNIATFVTEIVENFREIARKKSITLNIINKVGDMPAWFDVNMLDKVLFNLLSNAFKFTGEHGVINVTVEKDPGAGMVLIKVQDSGIGMSPEEVEHAFELFYQGHKETFKGTGLGLSLSKELINLHHGTIEIHSEKWKGATFIVSLPLEHRLQENEQPAKRSFLSHSYDDMKIYTTELESVAPEKVVADCVPERKYDTAYRRQR